MQKWIVNVLRLKDALVAPSVEGESPTGTRSRPSRVHIERKLSLSYLSDRKLFLNLPSVQIDARNGKSVMKLVRSQF